MYTSVAFPVTGNTGYCCSQVQNGNRQNCGFEHWWN